jgi:hypothetical protein
MNKLNFGSGVATAVLTECVPAHKTQTALHLTHTRRHAESQGHDLCLRWPKVLPASRFSV